VTGSHDGTAQGQRFLHFEAPDYCYGVGSLGPCITGVGNPAPGTEWLETIGHETIVNGIPGHDGDVSMRVPALRESRTYQIP
jgi:hypothetical protein